MSSYLKVILFIFLAVVSFTANSAQFRVEILDAKYLDSEENWLQGSFIFDSASRKFSNVDIWFSSDPLFDPGTFGYAFYVSNLNTFSVNPVKATFDHEAGGIGGSGKYFEEDYSFFLELPDSLVAGSNATLVWGADLSRTIYSGFNCNGGLGCGPPYEPNGDILESRHFIIPSQPLTAFIAAVPEPSALLCFALGIPVILSRRKNS